MTSVTLGKQLAELGLHFAADNLDDLVARATKNRWAVTELLGYLAVEEAKQRVARGVGQAQQKRLSLGAARGSRAGAPSGDSPSGR